MADEQVVNEHAVSDFTVADPTPDQPANAETPAPAETPVATAPIGDATASAIPLDVLNQSLRSVIGDIPELKSADDVVRLFGGKHKEMREKQELAAQAQTQLRQYKPFIDRMNQDKAYERRVYETSLDYAERINGQQQPDAGGGFDAAAPIVGEVLELKRWKEQREAQEAETFVNDSIEKLSTDPKFGSFVTADIKRDIALECAARGVFNPRAVFLDKYSDQLFAHVEAKAKKDYAAQVQATNASVAGLGTPTSVAPMATPLPDPATLPKQEADKWADDEIAHIARDPKYAAQLAREFENTAGQTG